MRDSNRDGCESLSPFFNQSHGASIAQYHYYRAASTPSPRCPLSSFFTSAGSGGSSGVMEALFAGPNPARGIRLEGYLAVKVPVDGIEKTSS